MFKIKIRRGNKPWSQNMRFFEIFRLIAREMGLDLTTEVEKEARHGLPVESAGDTLFTSGTLGRYSKMLNAVKEGPGGLYRG